MLIQRGPFQKMVVGGGRPFAPSNYPHLELWLDSRLGTGNVADGATLPLWADQSTNTGRSAVTQTASGFADPTLWKTTGAKLTPLSKPTVEWGLTTAFPGNILASQTSFTWPNLALRGYTFYWYGQVTSKPGGVYPAVNQCWFGGTNKIASFLGQNGFDGGGTRELIIVDNAGGGVPHNYGALAAISGGWHLHTLLWPSVFNNTVPFRYFVDGVERTQTSGNAFCDLIGAIGTNFYSLGNLWNGNVVCKALQGYCLWYSDTHSQGTINRFVDWTRAVWGLT